MNNIRKLTDSLFWVGINDRRIALFENVYPVPTGMSYNSYVLLDEKTALFDTVDASFTHDFLENVTAALKGRTLDYLIVNHMEPDHCAMIDTIMSRYPEAKMVCTAKAAQMFAQFYDLDVSERTLHFVLAPMVHWPEVMVTYDEKDKILFSADAFGTFGALAGNIFDDEITFDDVWMNDARRYYTNIVGKYGTQVQALLKKASTVQIDRICPLHGFVWRKNIGEFIDRYVHWSTYTPEEQGVMIAYASVYGGTENAAELLSVRLRERGVKTVMFDVSVTPASDIIAAAFRWSHLVFAAPTYNAGIFVTMENLLHDIVAHNLQNRTVALIENGSWAPTSGKHMRDLLGKLKNVTILDQQLTLRSAMAESQSAQLDALADALCATLPQPQVHASEPGTVDNQAMFALSYGLFVLSAREGERDNACIINTAAQVTDTPKRISITVNKQNLTHDMILKTGVFNLSVLSQDAAFAQFQQYGFRSGRDTADKFDGAEAVRTANGLRYEPAGTNAVLSGKVIQTLDCGTHTLFLAEVTEARVLSAVPSATYAYYFEHIKPKPQPAAEKKTGFVCKICGYVYEGETLPEDYICPLCKHGAEDFEPLK